MPYALAEEQHDPPGKMIQLVGAKLRKAAIVVALFYL
jgi:hypothetical protein